MAFQAQEALLGGLLQPPNVDLAAACFDVLAADLVATGITMCGGSSLLRGLPEMIEHETELVTRVAEQPLEAVARGTGTFLENLDLYSQFLEGGDDLG